MAAPPALAAARSRPHALFAELECLPERPHELRAVVQRHLAKKLMWNRPYKLRFEKLMIIVTVFTSDKLEGHCLVA
jgi:hypothetical protein